MSRYIEEGKRKPVGMYHPSFEHDNCGIGAIVNIKGDRKSTRLNSSHWS